MGAVQKSQTTSDTGDEGECTPLRVRAPEDVKLAREQHRIQAVQECLAQNRNEEP